MVADIKPSEPTLKSNTAIDGKIKIKIVATNPSVRLQKQIRGSTIKFASNPTSESLLKWYMSIGAVPIVAARDMAIADISQVRVLLRVFLPSSPFSVFGLHKCFKIGTIDVIARTAANVS